MIDVPAACFQSKSAAFAIRGTLNQVTARVSERTKDATKLWRFCFEAFMLWRVAFASRFLRDSFLKSAGLRSTLPKALPFSGAAHCESRALPPAFTRALNMILAFLQLFLTNSIIRLILSLIYLLEGRGDHGIDGKAEFLHEFLERCGLPKGSHPDARSIEPDIALPAEPCRLLDRDAGSNI